MTISSKGQRTRKNPDHTIHAIPSVSHTEGIGSAMSSVSSAPVPLQVTVSD
jgi:hypothetical protein